jgi:hypothetical protein
MFFTSQQIHEERLMHARWRVNFRRSLLDAHNFTPRNGIDWSRKEQELLLDLKRAMQQLSDLEDAGPPES